MTESGAKLGEKNPVGGLRNLRGCAFRSTRRSGAARARTAAGGRRFFDSRRSRFLFQNDKQKGDGYSLCSSRRFVSNRDDARLFRLSVLLVNGRSTATVIVQCVCRSSVNPFVIVFGSVVDARSRGGDI